MKVCAHVTNDKNKRVWKGIWPTFLVFIHSMPTLNPTYQENRMKKVSLPVEPGICYRKANPLQMINNQIQAKYIELGDKAPIYTYIHTQTFKN